MKSIITALLLLLLLFGCNKPIHRNNEITKVELARSGAWSDFGATISIDSSLTYKYYGDYGKVKQGFFTGKISEGFWDTLNRKLEEAHFKTAKYEFDGCKDCAYYQLIVHWNNKKIQLFRAGVIGQDSLIKVIYWIDSSYKRLKLQQTKDSIKFEAVFRPIPKPRIKSIKFPPPKPREY